MSPLHQSAVDALVRRDFAAAEVLLLQVIAASPSAEALNQLGAAQAAQRNYVAAEASFSQAVALAPQSAEAHYNLALVQRRHAKLDAAAAGLRQALRLRPDFLPARLDLADVLCRQGNTAEAAATLEPLALARLAPTQRKKLARILRRIGDHRTRDARHAQAEAVFRRAVEADPASAETFARLASSLAAQDRHDDAVPLFEKAGQARDRHLAWGGAPPSAFRKRSCHLPTNRLP